MKVAIYMRLSQDEKALGIEEVLRNHRLVLTRIAESKKYTYDLYQEVSSGVNNEREQLAILLSNLDKYKAVLCMDIDRISRDNAFAELVKRQLVLHGVKIITPTGEYDFSNENAEMLYSFQSLLANFEYKQIRKRLSRGRFIEASKGNWVMNRAPFGYRKNRETKRLEIEEDEAQIIRYMFNKTAEGVSANQIAREMKALGWKTKSGKLFTSSHISQMRKNVTYMGVVRYERKNELGKVLESCYVENAHPAIVEQELFYFVQSIIENHSGSVFHRRSGDVTRALQNMIYCAKCKRKRYIQQDGNAVPFIKACGYKIDNRFCDDSGYKYEPIERAVFQLLKTYKQSLPQALQQRKQVDEETRKKEISQRLQQLNIEKNKWIAKRKKLTILRLDDAIEQEEYEEIRAEIETNIQHITKQAQTEERKRTNMNRTEEPLTHMLTLLDELHTLDAAQVHQFLQTFIKKIHFATNESSTANHRTYKRTYNNLVLEIEFF